jgi:hypothetical protein
MDQQANSLGDPLQTIAIPVFNPTGWSEMFVISVPVPQVTGLSVVDGHGKPVEAAEVTIDEQGKSTLYFVGHDIPGLGFTTFFVSKSGQADQDCMRDAARLCNQDGVPVVHAKLLRAEPGASDFMLKNGFMVVTVDGPTNKIKRVVTQDNVDTNVTVEVRPLAF